MNKKLIATAVAAVTVASAGAAVQPIQTANSAEPTVSAKQAQAASLLKSIGTIVPMLTSPECTDSL
jgi:hypothetical protein